MIQDTQHFATIVGSALDHVTQPNLTEKRLLQLARTTLLQSVILTHFHASFTIK